MPDRHMDNRGHLSRHKPVYAFLAFATTAYLVGVGVLLSMDRIPHLDTVIAALTIDVVVAVPLAFFLLVVRPGRARAATVVPVAVISMIIATLLVPADYDHTLRLLRLLLIPLEVAILSYIAGTAFKTVGNLRSGSGTVDPVACLTDAATRTIGSSVAGRIAATELSVLYYGLCTFRSRPHVPPGSTSHSAIRRSGHPAIVLAIAVMIGMEVFPVHVVLGLWSQLAAWLVTIASIYGFLLIFGDYRATLLRPTLIDERNLVLRAGLRWNALVPLKKVAGVSSKPSHPDSSLDTSLTGTASHWLLLSEPVVVYGLYGIRRSVSSIGFQPDEPERFVCSLNAAIASL